MYWLAGRLRGVRVCCGDWKRVVSPCVLFVATPCAVFLDPPYSIETGRYPSCYAVDDLGVAHKVREWALQWGEDLRLRIALCGYEGEHDMPPSWECVEWKAVGGYSNQSTDGDNSNRYRERIWFSPHCLSGLQGELF